MFAQLDLLMSAKHGVPHEAASASAASVAAAAAATLAAAAVGATRRPAWRATVAPQTETVDLVASDDEEAEEEEQAGEEADGQAPYICASAARALKPPRARRMALSQLSGDEQRILFTQLCNVLDPASPWP